MTRSLALALAFYAVSLPIAQATDSTQSLASTEKVTPQLESCKLGQAKPAHRFGNLLLAGQPSEEDLPRIKARGIKTVINLRRQEETHWDEEKAVEQAGMNYVHVPFQGEEQLTSSVFDKVLGVLANKESEPTLLHCASANRVGAIWYAHRVLHDGIDPVEAELEAKQVGLRDEGYLKKAKEYAATELQKDLERVGE